MCLAHFLSAYRKHHGVFLKRDRVLLQTPSRFKKTPWYRERDFERIGENAFFIVELEYLFGKFDEC